MDKVTKQMWEDSLKVAEQNIRAGYQTIAINEAVRDRSIEELKKYPKEDVEEENKTM